jgi:hypothetical protein
MQVLEQFGRIELMRIVCILASVTLGFWTGYRVDGRGPDLSYLSKVCVYDFCRVE